MIFLGTGAGELSPYPFCGCNACRAKLAAGEVRKHSALLLDAQHLVDFGAEAPYASLEQRVSLADVSHIFITHSHMDHFSPSSFIIMQLIPPKRHITLYLSQRALAWVREREGRLAGLSTEDTPIATLEQQGRLTVRSVAPYEPFMAGDMPVFAVEGNHIGNGEGELALNYVFDHPAHGRVLYACDTGLYTQRTLEALAGKHLDIVIMEGTFGDRPLPRDAMHLNADHFIEQMNALAKCGAIDETTRIYMTHICQAQGLDHAGYQAYLDTHSPFKVYVARDGDIVE